MQNEEFTEEEEGGTSFKDIFKILLKRIWWVVGAMALAVILAVLVTQLWYNKRTRTYSVKYDVVFPTTEEGKYPDGSNYLVSDSISLETLTSIKNGEYTSAKPDEAATAGEFKNINVEKMVENDDISISTDYKRNDDNSVTRTYTLTVGVRYFTGEEQAVKFLNAVASYPVNRVNHIVDNRDYGTFFRAYEEAHTYEDKISALREEKAFILGIYNMLVNYDISVESDIAAMRNLFTDDQQQALADRIDANYYILKTDVYIKDMEARVAALQKQISYNNEAIARLKTAREDAYQAAVGAARPEEINQNPYDVEIARIVVQNSEYEKEIKEMETTKSKIELYESESDTPEKKAKADFDKDLGEYKEKLVMASETVKEVSHRVYLKNSQVIYYGNKVNIDGGINAILAAVLGAVVGLVVSALVICIIDLPKYKRQKEALAAASETKPEVEDTPVETPATDEK